MAVNRVAENVFGTIGTVCWTVQVLPQIYKSYRTKSTEGLSEWLLLIWALSGPFLGVYVIIQDLNIPLIVQPQLFSFLASISWAQCFYYGRKRQVASCTVLFFTLVLMMAAFEAGMVFAVRPAFDDGNLRPVQFFGIFSSVLISVGLLPQYWEIYKHKEMVGISMLFILVDWLGGVFSVLDGFVILAYFILNPAAKRRRAREAQEDSSIATTIVANTPERKSSLDQVSPTLVMTLIDEEKAQPVQVAL